MKRYILIGIAGVLLPLVVNGQTTTFFTTVGSPNGVFSALEVKGVELRGNDACGRGDATCSATVTNVDILEFLTRSAQSGNSTGMIYLPVSRSGEDNNTSRPADLGTVRFNNNSAVLTGNVRTVGTSPVAGAATAAQFTTVTVPANTEFHVFRVALPASPAGVGLNFVNDAPTPVNPLLAAGTLFAMRSSLVNISAMSLDRIWSKDDKLLFKERQVDFSQANGNWGNPCTGGSLASCQCDGMIFNLGMTGGISCDQYRLLRVN